MVQAMTKWISTKDKDKLPEPGTGVLALIDGVPTTMKWDGIQWVREGGFPSPPTHWMPLPELPKGVVGKYPKTPKVKKPPRAKATFLLVFQAVLAASAEGPSTISGIDRYLTRKGVNLSSASRILKTLHQCNILSESESRYAVAPEARFVYEWLEGLTRPLSLEAIRRAGEAQYGSRKMDIIIIALHEAGILQYVEHDSNEIKGFLINGVEPTFQDEAGAETIEPLIFKILTTRKLTQKEAIVRFVHVGSGASFVSVLSYCDGLIDKGIVARDDFGQWRWVGKPSRVREGADTPPMWRVESVLAPEPALEPPAPDISESWKAAIQSVHPNDLFVIFRYPTNGHISRIQRIPGDTPVSKLSVESRSEYMTGYQVRFMLYSTAEALGHVFRTPGAEFDLHTP